MVKWGYLIPRLFVALAIGAYLQFGFDPTLRFVGRVSIASATGRSVALESVESSFWPPRLTASHLQVAANERTDLAAWTADSIHVSINEEALLHRRFIADEVTVDGVEWNVQAEFEDEAHPSDDTDDSGWQGAFANRGKEVLARQLDEMKQRLEGQVDPDRFETVRLSRQKRTEYEASSQTLQADVAEIRSRVEQLRQIAIDPQARRDLLLDPDRLAQMIRDSKTLETDARSVRDQLRHLKDRFPEDYAELDAAKERDLAALQTDWDQLVDAPEALVDTYLQGPITDVLNHFEQWWPRWQKFRESGDWKRHYEAERRGRVFAFRPEHHGPDYGISALRMSGQARLASGLVPFQCELTGLTYPVLADQPAAFRWASDGRSAGVPKLEASGLVRLHNNRPELTVRFRAHDTRALVSVNRFRERGTVAFACEPAVTEGTLTLGSRIEGQCDVILAGSSCEVRTGDARLDPFLSSLDLASTELRPRVQFGIDGDQRSVNVRCDELASVGNQWVAGLQDVGRQASDQLVSRAERVLTSELQQIVDRNAALDELLEQISEDRILAMRNALTSPFGAGSESIRQTGANEVPKQATRLLDRLFR